MTFPEEIRIDRQLEFIGFTTKDVKWLVMSS
jgi:hypothetical protein